MKKPYLAWLIQFLSWPLIFVWSKIFNKLEIYGQENLKGLSGPLIIAPTHPSFWGSFLFRLALGSYTDLLPLRFLGTYDVGYPPLKFLKKIGLLWFIYTTFAVIPIVRGKGIEKVLERPKAVLEKGGVILIYPEGKLNHGREILPFKHGAVALSYMADVPILPVAVKMVKEKHGRTKYFISLGKPEKMPAGMSYGSATDYLYSRVFDLYAKI